MIYNYVLCYLCSITKRVVFALFCSLYFVEFYCIGFSMKLVWNRACIGWTSGSRECLVRSLPVKKPCEKHILEAEESCKAISFASVSREGPTRETLCLEDFKCDFFILHPYYIYPHYSQKYERPFREKNPR